MPLRSVRTLRIASQLHDIGKVGIPDSIVLNPRLLTEDERLTMQGHTEAGFKMLDGFRLAPCAGWARSWPCRITNDSTETGTRTGWSGSHPAGGKDRRHCRRLRRTPEQAALQAGVFAAKNPSRSSGHRRRAQLDPELLDLFIDDFERASKRHQARQFMLALLIGYCACSGSSSARS